MSDGQSDSVRDAYHRDGEAIHSGVTLAGARRTAAALEALADQCQRQAEQLRALADETRREGGGSRRN